MRPLLAFAGFALLAGAVQAAPPATIRIEKAEVRPVAKGLPATAAYMVIRNLGDRPDVLTAITCACAADVSAHETTERGGMSRMRASGPVTVPAKGAVVFGPGGRHLMLMGVKAPIRAGDRVSMTLTFAHAGAMSMAFVGKR